MRRTAENFDSSAHKPFTHRFEFHPRRTTGEYTMTDRASTFTEKRLTATVKRTPERRGAKASEHWYEKPKSYGWLLFALALIILIIITIIRLISLGLSSGGGTMFNVVFVLSAILFGLVLSVFARSFYFPQEGTIQTITRFGKYFTTIMAVKNRHVDKYGQIQKNGGTYKPSQKEKWNIYFFLWPLFRVHKYSFKYNRLIKLGEQRPGDVVAWKDETTGEAIISRSGISDHIMFQASYPVVTHDLYTSDPAKITVITTNVIEAVVPYKMVHRINETWVGITMETISGVLKGIMSRFTISEINQIRSEAEPDEKKETISANFAEQIDWVNKGLNINDDDGIEERYGVSWKKCVFRSFAPGDVQAKALLDSLSAEKIATQQGAAKVATASAEGDANLAKATKDAEAYAKMQAAIVEWRKKWLVDTGLAKVDASGNITELVPDANTRVGSEALKELAKLTGTLVINGDLKAMLNIQPTTGSVT